MELKVFAFFFSSKLNIFRYKNFSTRRQKIMSFCWIGAVNVATDFYRLESAEIYLLVDWTFFSLFSCVCVYLCSLLLSEDSFWIYLFTEEGPLLLSNFTSTKKKIKNHLNNFFCTQKYHNVFSKFKNHKKRFQIKIYLVFQIFSCLSSKSCPPLHLRDNY